MKKQMPISEIAELIEGTVIGDADQTITGAAAFETAAAQEITYAIQASFLKQIDASKAGAIIVPERFSYDGHKSLIKASNPELAFVKILNLFYPRTQPEPGIHPSAAIGKDVKLGKDISIGACAVIADQAEIGDRSVIGAGAFVGDQVVIGNDTVLFPNTTIMARSRIGNRVTICSGTVIGCDGFGYTRDRETYHKIPHVGDVRIDDDVEIGAGNTIDRGRFGSTWIQKGVKTDNLVHVAHNVVVGENTLLVAQAGIAGSVSLGKNVIIAGQVGIADHIRIGDHAIVGPRSGVAKDVESASVVFGDGPLPQKLWRRTQQAMPKLPDLIKKVRAMEKRIAELENK